MKKIYIDTQPILKNRTGIGEYSYNLIKGMLSKYKQAELTALTFDFLCRNNSREQLYEMGFEYVKTNFLFPIKVYKLFSIYLPIRYDLMFGGGDIYHFYNYIVPPISKKKKIVVNIYDMVYKLFPETMNNTTYHLLDKKLEYSLKRADAIITISENSKKEIMQFFSVDEKKIHIVYPGVDCSNFQKGMNIDNSKKKYIREKYNLPEKYYLYLGTLEPRKNITMIIDAYECLPPEIRAEYKLVIAGGIGWKAKSILEKINTSKCKDNIITTGYVDDEDKPYIYGLSSSFIFPSVYEGFGMPIIEAMASGVPVITADNSSLPEVGGEAVLYCDAHDKLELSNNMLRVIEDENLRVKMINDGIYQSQKFDWNVSVDAMCEVYKNLL